MKYELHTRVALKTDLPQQGFLSRNYAVEALKILEAINTTIVLRSTYSTKSYCIAVGFRPRLVPANRVRKASSSHGCHMGISPSKELLLHSYGLVV